MSPKGTSLVVLVAITGTLFQGIRALPARDGQNQQLKNETSLLPAEETVSRSTNKTLSSLVNEAKSSPAEGTLSPSVKETLSSLPTETLTLTTEKIPSSSTEGTLSSLPNGTLSLTTEKILSLPTEGTLSLLPNGTSSQPANETQLSPAHETLSPTTKETLSSFTDEPLSPSVDEGSSSTDNELLSPSGSKLLSSPSNQTQSSPAERTLSSSVDEALSSLLIVTMSKPVNETQSSPANGTRSSLTNQPSRLPTIVYGPINSQLGNNYPVARPGQASGEPAAPGAPIVYGSTTSQKNNNYVTIAQAGQVYLTVPSINEPLPVSFPGLFMPQNVSTGGLIFDTDNPMGKRIVKLISAFNTFQQSFDRTVRLSSPFLTDNEITPFLRKCAKDNFTRQTKEIKWLTAVASHRMKFIKSYELLSSIYNKLKLKLEITPEESDALEKKQKNLIRSEAKLKLKTQEFIMYVLLN